MCRRTEEVGPTVGLPRHRNFVGFFNVPDQAPTQIVYQSYNILQILKSAYKIKLYYTKLRNIQRRVQDIRFFV